jgi:hypothetical protein
VQGSANITGTSLYLDGGRIFRNEGTVTQTNANVDLNWRRSGTAEAGNGTVTNAASGTWNSNATATNSNYILASSQGAGDTGAGAVFTNQGTFNKLGAAITEVRTAFNNTGLTMCRPASCALRATERRARARCKRAAATSKFKVPAPPATCSTTPTPSTA